MSSSKIIQITTAYDETNYQEHNKICSCCLSTSYLKNMQCDFKNENGEVDSYSDVMERCFDSKIICKRNSMEAMYICEECIERLLHSYSFKCQVMAAQKTLQDYIRIRENNRKLLDQNKMYDESQNMAKILESARKIKNEDDIFLELENNRKLLDQNNMYNGSQNMADMMKSAGKIKNEDDIFHEDIDISGYESSPEFSVLKKQRKNKIRIAKRLRKSAVKLKVNKSRPKQPKLEKEFMKDRDAKIYASLDMNNMQCKICLKKFRNSHVMAMHANEHFMNYTCEVCGKAFALRRRYIHHVSRHATGNFQCGQCDKNFDSKIKLQNHIGNHHAAKHVCKFCQERFRSYYTRQKHMRDAHGEAATYPCDKCKVVCLTVTALNAHVRQRHLLRERTHSCMLCDKEFYTSNSLKRHAIVHSGERIYECDECGKAFARMSTLAQHLKIHSNVKEHVCSECGQGFVQKYSLKWHMKKHEKKTAEDSDNSNCLVIGE